MEKCSASSRSSRLAMYLVNYKEKGGGLMRCLIFHGSSCVCSFSDHDVAKTLHYGVKKKLKRKEMSLLSLSLLTSQYIWRLARLILFDLVFFFDLITERIFRLAFYFGFVVVDLHFFVIFFFSHDLFLSFKG